MTAWSRSSKLRSVSSDEIPRERRSASSVIPGGDQSRTICSIWERFNFSLVFFGADEDNLALVAFPGAVTELLDR